MLGNIIDYKRDIRRFLEDIHIKPQQSGEEKKVEKHIVKCLKEKFGADQIEPQYSVGGFSGMKVDIDCGDGKVGIELKLAKSLNNSVANIQRLFGQAIYYDKRRYQGNLIIVVVGNSSLKNEPFMREIGNYLMTFMLNLFL